MRPIGIASLEETSCSAGNFAEAGAASVFADPHLTVTLTDETPSTGQETPNGEVLADGIHGHRIEKTIRLKIDIRDASGQVPTYPVLVHLDVGGLRHGSLILDGNPEECGRVEFLWREPDGQGNFLNERFNYKLGTYAPYVGAIPDPLSPDTLKPVWGMGETLKLNAGVVDGSSVTYPVSMKYYVHPEPGKPDHFAVFVPPPPPGTPDPVWIYWSDYDTDSFEGYAAAGNLYNGYYLMDHYDNVTFGYTGLAQPGAPMTNVTVTFFDQTSGVSPDGATLVEPVGYGWRVSWLNHPQGTGNVPLTINYPTDPEWPAGAVTVDVAFQFDVGTFHFVTTTGSWDSHYFDRCVNANWVEDPDPPYSASPGAVGDALPKSQGGADGARVALLTGLGSTVPLDPLEFILSVYSLIEVSDNPAFRLSLVDAQGRVATDAIFQVHLCPRWDHFAPSCVPRTCSTAPVGSDAGVVQIVRVNASGPGMADSQGYMGIELLKAPSNPGTYYMKIEALEGRPYRMGNHFSGIFWDRTPDGRYQGSFAFVTVTGIEILDSSFRHIYDLAVAQPQVVYARYFAPAVTTASVVADLTAVDSGGGMVSSLSGVVLSRVGTSSVFLSGPITVEPPADTIGPFRAHPASASGVSSFELRAAQGLGTLTARPANQPLFTVITTLTGLQFDFQVGQLGTWTEPNLLFGDGADYVDMHVRITDAAGHPLPQNFGVTMNLDQGSLWYVSQNPDPQGRISFRYIGPSMPLGQDSLVRPTFGFTFTFPDGVTTQASDPQTARPPSNCKRETDLETSSHCFGDPNFPMAYSKYDFRRLVYYRSASDPAPLTDEVYAQGDSMDESAIQQFLEAHSSVLARLYIVAPPALLDNTDPLNPLYATGSGVGWPITYITVGAPHTAFAAGDSWDTPPNDVEYSIPPVGTQGVGLAHVLARWCSAFDVNPKVMLVHLQKEHQMISDSRPSWLESWEQDLLGVKGDNDWVTPQIAAGVKVAQSRFQEAAGKGLPVSQNPHDGFLWPVRKYGYTSGQNINFAFGADYTSGGAVALFSQTQGAFALLRYTNYVRTDPTCGGVCLFMQLWAQYHFDQN